MGGAVSISDNNDDMVTKLIKAQYIKSTNVEQAFRAVDRANYVLNTDSAYSDSAWKTDHLHVSAPCIYARVLEGLLLEPGQSFLNIGSGTGYLSTMVATILGSEGTNHGIELRGDVIRYANLRLKHFKKTPSYDDSFFAHPVFVEGNAFLMQPPKAKYDRIYCGAAVPLSFVDMMRDHFLNVGGVMVAPVEDELVQVYKESPGRDICTSLLEVSFAHLVRRVPGDNIAIVADNTVSLPSHQVRSLQEQCRAVVVHLVRSKVIQEKPNRGGVFAPVIALENSLPLPPIPSDIKKAKPCNAASESIVLGICIDLHRNLRNEHSTLEGPTSDSENVAPDSASTSAAPASSKQVNQNTPAGNALNSKDLVTNPNCTSTNCVGAVDPPCNYVMTASTTECSSENGASTVRASLPNESVVIHFNPSVNMSEGDIDMTVPTIPVIGMSDNSVACCSSDTVSEVQITSKVADTTVNETNVALLNDDSTSLLNKMIEEDANVGSDSRNISFSNAVDVPMDVAFSNEVTVTTSGSCTCVDDTIRHITVERSSDQSSCKMKFFDQNDKSMPSTSASVIYADDKNSPSSDETNADGASTPLTYPLLTHSHLTMKEYMTTHFISTKTMYHGYREDRRVFRVCGKTVLESHRSANINKSEKPVDKHPPFKLRTGHQDEDDAANTGDEEEATIPFPDSDSDVGSNASSGNTSESSHHHNEEEAQQSSSSSSLSDERVAVVRKRNRVEMLQQRKIRAFNIRRSWMKETQMSSNVVEPGSAVSTEGASQIPLPESNDDKIDDVLPQKEDGSLEDCGKVDHFASITEPSTSGQLHRETVETACKVDLLGKHLVIEKLSVEAMDVDESSEANVSSCVDMEVEDINSGNNTTLFVTEAKEICNKLSDKDDDKKMTLKLASKTDSSPRETPSLKRSSSDSDDEVEQNSSDSVSPDAVDSKGRRKKAMKRQLADGPKSSPRCNKGSNARPSASGDDSETNSSDDFGAREVGLSSCPSHDLSKKGKLNKSKVDKESSTSTGVSTSRRTPTRPSEGWRTVGGDTGEPSARNREEENFDLNRVQILNRRVNNSLSMISLFNRFAYSVPDRDSMYSEALNVRDDSANDSRNENVDGDSADNIDIGEIEDAMFQRRRNLGSLRRTMAARNDVMSSTDEEPEYFKQHFKPRSAMRPERLPRRKKEKLWIRGTDGFDSYIDSKHRKCPFDCLPRERRLEIRIQDRLHRLPLPPQVLDYLLTGRWPKPPLPSTLSSADEKEESLC